ncbi:hypothetical protein, partial [Roseivivax sp.]
AVFTPASCSRRIAMICSSLNFDLFIFRSSYWAGLYHQMEGKSGVTAPVTLNSVATQDVLQ